MDARQIGALSRFVRLGFLADPGQQFQPILHGIAHPTATGWVVSRVLLAQHERLSTDKELVMALLALLPELRQPWLRILAARCKEAGHIQGETLQDLITQLQGAALWVEEELPHALLAATPTAAVERELLGVSAEQAAATPMLTRIIAASLALHEAHAQVLSVLPAVDISGMRADRNWIAGRLLALPGSEADRDYVLLGAGENATDDGAMAWVLTNPWALLLAMVAYTQDTWAAEARGGLLLELPAGQNAYQPGEVTVLVQGPDGDETRCGTLAELLLRALNHLDMHGFPRQPALDTLNTMIAPLVGRLLQRRVWRYLDGASGSYGQYQIHPEFADDCYRISGSKVFNRTGRHLWQTVRIQAEQWRSELLPARLLRGD